MTEEEKSELEAWIDQLRSRLRKNGYDEETIAKREGYMREAARLTEEGKSYTFDLENGCKVIDD